MLSSSIRFEDREWVLRLFPCRDSAMSYPGVAHVIDYGYGWISQCFDGSWVDAAGHVPKTWSPQPGLVN